MNLVEAAMERRRREQTSMSIAEIVADDIAHETRGQPNRKLPAKERAGRPAPELPVAHYAWSQPR